MTTDRRRARIIAMQALCHCDAHADDLHDVIAAVAEGEDFGAAAIEYARRLCTGFLGAGADVDSRIQSAMEKWSIDRLGSVERNVLRTAVVELELGEVPPRVVINEAVDIAREYGSAESAAFVNGVVDRIWAISGKDD